MLSRVAENLYWMARYLERAEDSARLINVSVNLLLDLPRGVAPGWEPLIAITGSRDQFLERYEEFSERKVLKFLTGDLDYSGSILGSIQAARENCRAIRDIVTREVWEQLNELHIFAKDNLSSGLTKRGRHPYLKQVILAGQTVSGMISGTMIHDQGYQFLRLGRFIERADMTTRIIDVRSADLLPEETQESRPFDTIQWVSVLKSLTAYQMYRRAMQVRVRRPEVLRFLLLDRAFPRSVRFSLDRVENGVKLLGHNEGPLRAVARVQRLLQSTQVAELSQLELHQFLDALQLGLIEVHSELATGYFLRPAAEAA